jgi:3-oxoacyl-ACP reductase-like protein
LETTSDVQMETAQPVEDENDNAVSAGEGADEPPAQTTAVNMSKILAERCPDLTAEVLKSQVSRVLIAMKRKRLNKQRQHGRSISSLVDMKACQMRSTTPLTASAPRWLKMRGYR